MDPKSPSKFKPSVTKFLQCHRTVKTCGLALAIVLLLAGAYHIPDWFLGKSYQLLGSAYYTVVVDCGSTGTRANVYEWKLLRCKHSLPVLVHSYPDNYTKDTLWKTSGCRYHCMQTEPGIDKFVGNYSGVEASIEPLIRWAESVVPSNRHEGTHLLILATAGLRRLQEEKAMKVMEDVEKVAKKHQFVNRKRGIRVLSGEEEAYYGWIALNYKMGRLETNSTLPTLGLLDLGGSSLQVVMEANGSRKHSHLLRPEIGAKSYQLLGYSLPEFGLNEAFDRSVAMISQENLAKGDLDGYSQVGHPCLGTKFVQNYSCSYCLRPNGSDRKENGTITLEKNHLTTKVFLAGDPNFEKCKRLAKGAALNASFSDWSKTTKYPSCNEGPSSGNAIDTNVLNIPVSSYAGLQFHALSGFFAVYNTLKLPPRANMTRIWEEGQKLCSSSWHNMNNSEADQYCFKVLYMATLIENALCIATADVEFGPGDVSWTLGASLVEHLLTRNQGFLAGLLSGVNYKAVIWSPLFVFIFLLLISFIVYRSQIKLPMLRRSVVRVRTTLPSYDYSKQRHH